MIVGNDVDDREWLIDDRDTRGKDGMSKNWSR